MSLSRRFRRRTAGLLKARLPELALEKVPEVRSRWGKKRWRVSTILRAVVVGLAAGCKGLGELEELTGLLSRPMRKLLGLTRRLPDTTVRDLLVRLPATALRSCIYTQGQSRPSAQGAGAGGAALRGGGRRRQDHGHWRLGQQL